MTEGHFTFVMMRQTNEEAKAKYWLARSLGATVAHARRMRCWRLAKIERRFGLPLSKSHTLVDGH